MKNDSEAGIANACTQTKRTRAPRDPEGRRRAIAQAAAEILVEEGPSALTHRKAAQRAGVPLGSTTQHFSSIDDLRLAGMQLLAEEFDKNVDEFAEELRRSGCDAKALAQAFQEYLSNTDQVRRSAALMSAAVTYPEIRALARASDRHMGETIVPILGEERAQALWMLADGFTAYAALHDTAPDFDTMCLAIGGILAASPEDTRTHGTA